MYRNGRPQNYADVVLDGIADADRLPERTVRGIVKVQCPCGRWVKAFVVADVRDLPAEVTRGAKWACDGCWKAWTRDGAASQRTIDGRPFTEIDWVEAHGAPAVVIEKFSAAAREKVRRLEAKRDQATDRGDARDAVRWQEKIDQRVRIT